MAGTLLGVAETIVASGNRKSLAYVLGSGLEEIEADLP